MLYLRVATPEDCSLIWQWANDPEVRAVSFSSDPIPWESHVKWFQNQLDRDDRVIFIAMSPEQIPIGQVRFSLNEGNFSEGDSTQHNAVISISLDHQFRGQGYGINLIKLACQALCEKHPVHRIHAYVKPDNLASLKAFAKAGFQSVGRKVIHDLSAEHLILEL